VRFPLLRFARRFFGAVLAAGLLLAGVARAQFTERATAAGLNVSAPTSTGGHTDDSLDAYSIGSAAAAVDLDGDGWTDLVVARAGAPCLVFMNNRDGTFREDSAGRGLEAASDVGGIGAGDIDNDGDADLFMTPISGSRYFLFLNDGAGRFREVAVERGADVTVTIEKHRGQSVSFVDYDRDGYLDIFVSEWSVVSNADNARHNVLLRNRGAAAPGFFENRTAASGLRQPGIGTLIANYAAGWADYDGDGAPDVFIAGDFGTNQVWWNNGDGTFFQGTDTAGVRSDTDGMGLAVFDYDGDGRLDVFVSAIDIVGAANGGNRSFISDNRLYRNLGNRQFLDVSTLAGVKQSGWGWGAGQLDADNDGWPDLVVTNGYVTPLAGIAAAANDPTRFFRNQGGTFTDATAASGITDTGLGRSVVIFDYDNDGREDVFITQNGGPRLLYRNESPATARWLALRLVGTQSNRSAYGTEVTITAGGRTQTALYNPTNAYLGQREPRLHFGLGSATTVDRIRVKWPNGAVQELTGVAANQLLTVTESATAGGGASAPVITVSPASTSVAFGGTLTLSASASGSPAPSLNWFKDGVRLTGATGATLTIDHVAAADAGNYTATATNPSGSATSAAASVTVTADLTARSVARWWDEILLNAIRRDTPNPPVHARNLYHTSAALWDAFWAYETGGWTTRREVFTKESPTLPATESERVAAQREAMSYAAYTVLRARFARSVGVAATTADLRWMMQQFGLDPDRTDASGNSPAAVGIRIGQRVIDLNLDDGANEAGNYANATTYAPVNPALLTQQPGVGAGVNPDRWQPLNLANTITQNGIVLGSQTQSFVGVNAIRTRTFALARGVGGFLAADPGPPPRFNDPATRAEYVRQAREVVELAAQLGTADGVAIDLSPGRTMNNALGTNNGTGRSVNPVTGSAYASNVVLRGDFARVLAEYWADGPQSETPPGHWNVIFNQVSDDARTNRRFGGQGEPLRRLEWDVVGYLALNAALHDAACAAWTLKWEYDSARPITMIRYLAALGQSSDPAGANYHANGLPLVPGVIELVTPASSAPGQPHAHLAGSVGQVAVRSWLGTPASPTQASGVGWILGVYWMPYQRETFVTPAFPAYVSGHSTFSRAAAEVMARLTGSEFFPGGLATKTFAQGAALAFEYGPAQTMQLQWATYYDAADQAGLSRLYGGIHVAADDFTGRRLGSQVGIEAFAKFQQLYGTNVAAPPSGQAGNNSSGTTTTTTTTTTVTTTTTSAPSGGGGGGGGGAPSPVFVGVVALALVVRALRRR
jgi:hypothetical protein